MAYAEYSISSVTDIPQLVEDFARTVGWWVGTGAILRHPDYEGNGPGGLRFQLSASVSGIDHRITWKCQDTGFENSQAFTRSPVLANPANTAQAVVQIPSKLFLISRLDPEPYIAIVIEYGYNLYRHLYFGFAEKVGDYQGGEIVSGCNGWQSTYGTGTSGVRWDLRSWTSQLFNGVQSNTTRNNSGGIHIQHADNAQPWRRFSPVRLPNISAAEDLTLLFDGSECIGGYGDSFNDPYVSKGKNAVAGASVLTPINLMSTQMVTGDVRFIPVGIPAGVRMINIQELESQAISDVGGENWYSFAAFAKRNDLFTRKEATLTRWPNTESSYFLGYAYRG
ncbi:hypothetical protein G3A39_39360 [Paraburkholderia aspalathi]|nr:hypothetical protein [Paraburkholderia aspalathi]